MKMNYHQSHTTSDNINKSKNNYSLDVNQSMESKGGTHISKRKATLLPINEALKQLHHVGPPLDLDVHGSVGVNEKKDNRTSKERINQKRRLSSSSSFEHNLLDVELSMDRLGLHTKSGTNPIKISPDYVPLCPLDLKKAYEGERKVLEMQGKRNSLIKKLEVKSSTSDEKENEGLKLIEHGSSNKIRLKAIKTRRKKGEVSSSLSVGPEKGRRKGKGNKEIEEGKNQEQRVEGKRKLTRTLDEVAIIPGCLLDRIIDTPNHIAVEERQEEDDSRLQRKRKTSATKKSNKTFPVMNEIVIVESNETPRSARSSSSKTSKVSSTSSEPKSITSVNSIVSRSSQEIIETYRQALYQNSVLVESETKEDLEERNSTSNGFVFLAKEDYFRVRATHLLAQRRRWEAKVERAKERKAATEIWNWLRYEAKKEWLTLRDKRRQLKEHQKILLTLFQLALKHKATGVAIKESIMLKDVRLDQHKRYLAMKVINTWMRKIRYKRILCQVPTSVSSTISRFCERIKAKYMLRRRQKGTDLLRKFLRDARSNATKNYILRLRKRISIAQKICRDFAACRKARLDIVTKLWRKVWKEKREEQRKQRSIIEKRSMKNALQNKTIGNYVKKMYASKTVIEQNLHACNVSMAKLRKYNQFENARKERKANKALGSDGSKKGKDSEREEAQDTTMTMERDLSTYELECIQEILYKQRRLHMMTNHTRYETLIRGKAVERQDAIDLLLATDMEIVYEISRKIAQDKVSVRRFTPFQIFFCHGFYLLDLIDERISEIFEEEELEKAKKQEKKLKEKYQQWLKENEGKEDPYLMEAGGTAPPSSAPSLGVYGDSRRRQSVSDGTIFLQKEKEMAMIRKNQEGEKENAKHEFGQHEAQQVKLHGGKRQQFSN